MEAGIRSRQRITVTTPAGQQGDLLVAILVTAEGRSPVSLTGWTLIDTGTTDSADVDADATLAVWYRIADGSEPSTYDFGWTGGPAEGAVAILRYRDVDPDAPIGTIAVGTGEGNAAKAPAVASGAGARILRIYAADGGEEPAGDGYPDGHEGRFALASDGSAGLGVGAADAVVALSGTVEAATFDLGEAIQRKWRALTLVINASPAAASLPLADQPEAPRATPATPATPPPRPTITLEVSDGGTHLATNLTLAVVAFTTSATVTSLALQRLVGRRS